MARSSSHTRARRVTLEEYERGRAEIPVFPAGYAEPGGVVFARPQAMTERRSSKRSKTERRHPLRSKVRLKPSGPALERRARQRLTVKLDADTVEHLRDAVFWTPDATIAGLVERCIIETVERMEAERGSKFPTRERELPVGRPRK